MVSGLVANDDLDAVYGRGDAKNPLKSLPSLSKMDLSAFQSKPKKNKFELRIKDEATTWEVDFDVREFLASLGVQKTRTPRMKSTSDEFRVEMVGTIVLGKQLESHGALFTIEPKLFKLANRTDFVTTMVEMLRKYAKPLHHEAATLRCDAIRSGNFPRFTHQKILREYLTINSPYRGLLVYHGLGSGKTCASIGIAEGLMKAYPRVYVLTPASLETNYRKDFAKCSDTYTRLRHWVREGKSWTYEPDGPPNYEDFTPSDQRSIDTQLKKTIEKTFRFVHYNGLTSANLSKHFPGQGNPLEDTVVVIDEVHRFVSIVTNALGVAKKTATLTLYNWLLEARNCRIVALSGTPINNRPHELGVLFNMLRGLTTTWAMSGKEADLPKEVRPTLNYVDEGPPLVVTRTPDHFVSEYETKTVDGAPTPVRIGVVRTTEPQLDDAAFTRALKSVYGEVTIATHKALPDTRIEFEALSENTFKRRILGLVSYFPDLTGLMPQLNEADIHKIPMSKTQLVTYAAIRSTELEHRGSYLPASRAACNFVYPDTVQRPKSVRPDAEDEDETVDPDFERALASVIREMKANGVFTKDLGVYSPKFQRMMEVIGGTDALQLVYSSFLNNEGLVLFAAVLDAHGYEELRLKKSGGDWSLATGSAKPKYIMYTGKLDDEEREVLRNIFNQDWAGVPLADDELAAAKKMHVQLFLVTSAGAEGISLMDVKHVHLMEPFWTPQRFEQVVGRARRICSHRESTQGGVTPHIYIMTGKTKREDTTTDERIYETANEKLKANAKWLQYVKDTAIECNLHGMNCYRTNQVQEYVSAPLLEQEETLGKQLALNDAAAKFKSVTLETSRGPVTAFYAEMHPKDKAGRVYYPLFEYAASKHSIGYVSFDEGQETFSLKLDDAPKLMDRKKKDISIPALGKKITLYMGPLDTEGFAAIYKENSDTLVGFKNDKTFYTANRAVTKPIDLFRNF